MIGRRLAVHCALVFSLVTSGAFADTIALTATSPTQSLTAVGTSVEFMYVTGPGKGGKELTMQQFYVGGIPMGAATTDYESADYVFTFGSTIPAGSDVTAATLDLSTAVSQALALATATLEAYPKSFSVNSACLPSGAVGPGLNPGNCSTEAFTQSASGLPAIVISVTVGGTTYAFNGTAGVDIATLGTVNLATLNPAFLVELGAGNPISITWRQLVSLTGSVGTLGDNMLCKNCTVYYTVTSSASQNSSLTADFNAIYSGIVGPSEIPEPSPWLAVASGLALLGAARFHRR